MDTKIMNTNRSQSATHAFVAPYGQDATSVKAMFYSMLYGNRLTSDDLIKCANEYISVLPIDRLDIATSALEQILSGLVSNVTDRGQMVDREKYVGLQPWFNELVSLANAAGFTLLGSGFFSAAFTHRLMAGKVIKVGFKKEDSGAAYAAFCRANQGKEGIPEVYSIARHEACYMVIMKHYVEIEKYSPEDGPLTPEGRLTSFVAALIECEDPEVRWGECSIMMQMKHEYPELHKTCRTIREFFKGVAHFDCHAGNMMWDEQKSCIVITDPVSYSRNGRKEPPKEFLLYLNGAENRPKRLIDIINSPAQAVNLIHAFDAKLSEKLADIGQVEILKHKLISEWAKPKGLIGPFQE
ncbi:protein kinase; inhibitor of host transcription; positively regulates RNaseIII; negatively on RNaseE [Pectobacterium phage DU_PP_II]|uniref:Protein kinase n=1 Tax=Pectobacterium phage DU_PP_II TaxID=2041489 RepID=A0A2D2W681_9CAUD|nr:protein kinase; inhibitor of host transcription; positively regulates RNaseIII; negatively on RNaseE [Pectobacterium phage DU_PP_II]ATS93670.1 protein kinase [Pectobacterium phage DU_PP_II]